MLKHTIKYFGLLLNTDYLGVVPSSFRILRNVLNRIENQVTGEVHKEFHVNVPPARYKEAYEVAESMGEGKVKNVLISV